MKKIIFSLLLLFSFKNIYAFENDIFSLDIPEKYEETINKNNIYKWDYKNNYISVSISDNKNLMYDVNRYGEEQINEERQYIQDKLNNELKDYKIEVEVSNGEFITINDKTFLYYDIFWPSKNVTGYDTYQKQLVVTTKNYITTIIYSSDKEINNEEFNKFINTFNIKDDNIVYNYINYKRIVIVVFILILCFSLMIAIFKKIITN